VTYDVGALLEPRGPASAGLGDSPQLVGRDAELDRIDRLLRGAREGRSDVLVVCGPAGIGKSALLDAARGLANDMQILACRGVESEARLPFAGLHQLLRPLLDDTRALPRPQARALRCALGLESGAASEPFLVSVAVLSVLGAASQRRPVTCLIDDAQWIDDATLGALVFAARRLNGEPVALLFATRELDARLDPVATPRLNLLGLDAQSAHAILDRTVAGLSPEVVDRLVQATAGNPLALLELPAGLSHAQRSGTEPIVGPLPISSHLERAYLDRVRELPKDTQDVLLVAAADESGAITSVLDAAARLGIGAHALDDAEAAGLIRVRGMRVELRHPLVRSAVYQGAPLSRRRAAHAALADVLVGDARADRRAWHRAAASVSPDAAVVRELEEAGRRASARGAYDAASLALERAAALAGEERDRARLLTEAAENAWLPGKVEHARALLRTARALGAEPVVRAEIGRLLGLIELTCGVPAQSSKLLMAAAADAEQHDPERALYLLSLASWGAAFARDSAAVVATADRALTLSVPATDETRFLLRRLSGLRAHFRGEFREAAARLQEALALVDRLAPDGLPERLGLVNPVGLFLCDDRAVLELHRRAATRARDDGKVTRLTQALPWLVLGDIWSGHWPAAAAGLAEGFELARATGQHQIEAHLIAIDALLAALQGDEARCRARAAESLELAAARRLVHVTCCATWALFVLELGLGNAAAALTHATALPEGAGIDWDALDRIEAAIRAGDREVAAAWLEEFEPWAHASHAPWGEAVALHCRALLAQDPEEAERLFQAALTMHGRAARPFERARSELALGEFLRRARRRTDARTHLRAALERFETLGSPLWAERARIELRASGETARRRDPSTLDDLTPQELQIARLVAEGATNRDVAGRLFLSPRTIDFHLRNVFRKLGITSRTELARMDLACDDHHGDTAGASPGS
jgi:DNA-binding CsgD family transcriptional regulator